MLSWTDCHFTYSRNVTIGLIDIQTVDQPISTCECRRVVLHVIIAAVGEGGTVGASAPNSSGPVAAEVCVEDLGCGISLFLGGCSCRLRVIWEKWKRMSTAMLGLKKGTHDLHVHKVTRDIAIPLILRDRLFPRRWIRYACFEV